MSEDSRMTRLSVIRGGSEARASFEQFVRPHYAALFRVAARFTGSRADAEDLVQETCLRAYRHIARVETLENPLAWLLCILRRLYIDRLRRYESSNVSSIDEGVLGEIACAAPGPAESVNSEQVARRIERGLRKLGAEQRTLLILHDVEGYSLNELETITAVKLGTIKSKLHRARVKLGRLLQAGGDFADPESQWRTQS
jgi:RNA polymerase sigma-70 factor (ECF subfamily)